MAFAPGLMNMTKLQKYIDEGNCDSFKSSDGDIMIYVNVNFLQDQFRTQNCSNITLSLWSKRQIGKCHFASFKVDYEHLVKDGII